MTEIVHHRTAAQLLEHARDHLVADEAMNNHLFGVINSAALGAYDDGENVWLSAVLDGVVVGCALRTAPWPVAMSHGCSPSVARALAVTMDAACHDDLEFGISPHLAPAVAAALGCELVPTLRQGIYRLQVVRPPLGVRGRIRRAVEWDVDLVAQWSLAFQAEAPSGPRRTVSEARQMARQLVAAGALVMWDVDGQVVSMASARGPTPNGIRISLVYTPPQHRQRGYASACVAALSRRELISGRLFCFLFTDLANPTSNHVYRKIGYEMVGELTRYRRIDNIVR